MKKLVINGTEYKATDGAPLKDALIEYGMAFPCGGNGRCGKCRIRCGEIEPTDNDRRFLTENAIAEGWRIACDKKIGGDYVIECSLPVASAKKRELTSCNIVASIEEKEIKIGIADDEIAEEVRLNNPLYTEDGLAGIAERYERSGEQLTKLLRATLAKESIELFEKYGKAKAETFAIATNGLFARILTKMPLDGEETDFNSISDPHNFDLPTESVYFLPIINAYIGGDVLSETVDCPENTIFIDCGAVMTAIYIGKDNNEALSMWDMTYDELGLKAVRAAVKVLRKEGYTPFVRLYGEYAEEAESAILDEGLEYSVYEKKLSSAARVLGGLRFRAKLNKEKARTSVINALTNEDFHRYFAE